MWRNARISLALLLTGSLLLVAPTDPAAAFTATADLAGTIVYIHDDDVWIATPDGSKRRRLTTDGTASRPYAWPSEDAHGRVVALHGQQFVVMDQFGTVAHRYTQPLANTGPALFASVSPDGTTIGYSVYTTTLVCYDGDCTREELTTFHYLNTAKGTLRDAWPSAAESDSGSFVTDTRTVLDDGVQDVYYQDAGQQPVKWFEDCDYANDVCSGDQEVEYWHAFPSVDRRGDRYASVVVNQGYASPDRGATFLNLMDTAGFDSGSPAAPTVRCYLFGQPTLPQGDTVHPGLDEVSMQTPSWSPSGRSLAVSVRDDAGIWQVSRLDIGSDLVGNCDPSGWDGSVILDDARMPRWSPAVWRAHPPKSATSIGITLKPHKVRHGKAIRIVLRIRPGHLPGKVRILDHKRVLHRIRVTHGRLVWRTKRLGVGRHRIHATYPGDRTHRASGSKAVTVRVLRNRRR